MKYEGTCMQCDNSNMWKFEVEHFHVHVHVCVIKVTAVTTCTVAVAKFHHVVPCTPEGWSLPNLDGPLQVMVQYVCIHTFSQCLLFQFNLYHHTLN